MDEDQWMVEKSSDPRSNEELINALRIETDDEIWPDMFTSLQDRKDPDLIHKALEMCKSIDSIDRWIGVGILAQNSSDPCKQILPKECLEALLDRICQDSDEDVLVNSCFSLRNYEDLRISTSLVRLKNHSDRDVRYAVVHGLLGRRDSAAVDTLIELTRDSDEEVRNWATFGIGWQIDMDTPEIREALLRRVDDDYDAVRGEALRGLASLGDERVIEPLIKEIYTIAESEEWWNDVFEAAEKFPCPELYPALMAAKDSGIEEKVLDRAIALCRIPNLEEGNDKPTKVRTSCPVCMLKNAFKRSGRWQFCKRCGWEDDPDQIIDPESTGGFNNDRSLNQERERWQKRLEAAKQ